MTMKSWVRNSPFQKDCLSDRVVLSSGGGSGIGFEVARQLGAHGAKLVVMGRRENFLKEAVELFKKDGIEADYFAGDVRKPEDCAGAVDKCMKRFGALNVLINGAAGLFPGSLGESITPNGFRTVIEIDLIGTHNLSNAAFPALKESGKGVILNITVPRNTLAGQNWWAGHMQSAKAGVTTLANAMAKEWAEFGIRVNCVGPGAIADTPAILKTGNKEMVTATASKLQDGLPVLRTVPLGRMGSSFEIGMACVFLCVSEYITAETVVVDGGWWLGGDRPAVPRERLNQVTRANEEKSRAMKPKL